MNLVKKLSFVVILVLLAGCSSESKPLERETLPQLYDNNLNNVTKIAILAGNSGAPKITGKRS